MPSPENSGITCIVVSSTASALTGAGRHRGRPRHRRRRGVHHVAGRGAAHVDHPAARAPLQQHLGDPGLLLQLRASRSASACSPSCGDSSQNTQERQRLGRSPRLSSVIAAMCQDKSNLRRTARWRGRAGGVLRADDDDRSIQLVATPFVLRPGLSLDEGREDQPNWLHSIGRSRAAGPPAPRSGPTLAATPIGGPCMPVPEPLRPPDDRRSTRAAGRAVRGAHGGHDRVGDPGAVRRGEPARGGLARRRHAEPRRAAARRARRRGRPSSSPATARSRCSTAPAQGDPGAARADLRGDGARGRSRRRPGRRRGHGRLAAGAGPGHPASSATRATWCSPRGRPTWARSGSFAAYQARVVHVAMDADGLVPELLREALPHARRAQGVGAEVPLHDPELPQPGRRHAGASSGGARCSTSAPSTACRRWRTTRTACSASPGEVYPALRARWTARRHLPRLVLQDVRVRACGSAGRWYRPRCATGWCSPPSRRRCARRRSPSCWCRATSPRTTGAGRSRRSPEVYRERRDAMLAALET